MTDTLATFESFSARLDRLANEQGDLPAISYGETTLTFDELNRAACQLGRHMTSLGVGVGDFVTIGVPNSNQFIVSAAACWKIGAVPQPVSSRLPKAELEAIIELADSALLVGVEGGERPSLPFGFEPNSSIDDSPLPEMISPAWKAPTSGGSTGRPKLIVSGDPSVIDEGLLGRANLFGAETGGVMVMPGPLYHNGPFIWAIQALMIGCHIAILGRFDAEKTLAAVEAHKAQAIYVVPTMMQRIWKLDDETKNSYDLRSLRKLWHLAEPCPQWLKREWIDWLGPDVIWELYGGTEGQSATVLDGNEWLTHVGSVGRPISGELKILDEDGALLPAGEIGEVWMRPVGRDRPTYYYLGAEAETRDGWDCLGDIGWLDEEGYLYLADRRSDMILVGGANVFPAEVEAAINLHPSIGSSAVIGLPDDEIGNKVHAIVEATTPIEPAELMAHLAEHLVTYKLPRSIEFVSEPLRDDAGKVRRSALRAERLQNRQENA